MSSYGKLPKYKDFCYNFYEGRDGASCDPTFSHSGLSQGTYQTNKQPTYHI